MLSGPAPRERAPQPKRSWLAALGGALRPDLPGAAAPAQKPVRPPTESLTLPARQPAARLRHWAISIRFLVPVL